MTDRIVDLAPYLCLPETSIREALARLDAVSGLCQLVVQPEGLLVGTVTDGDVRRALLQGATLDDPVSRCMHRDFLAGRVDEPAENRRLLIAGERAIDFLPILDAEGALVDMLVRSASDLSIRHALVMAGGFGRRLGDRTKTTPKPLLPVGGKPILDRVLCALEESGVPRVSIAIHYLAEQIEQFVAGRDNRAEIDLLHETEPLGTAGALGLLPDTAGGPLLVVNGDVLTGVDFPAVETFHRRHGLDATIAVTRHETEIPYGVVRFDEDGLFERVEEKPTVSHFVAAGVYYLAPEFLSLIKRGQRLDMPDLLNMGKKIGLRIGVFPIHEYWADVGRPEDLAQADATHNGHDRAEGTDT